MKKIVYIIIVLIYISLISEVSFCQLPLQYGDAVITHSPNTYTSSGPSTTPTVVRVVHTSNTSTASLGATWNVPSNGGTKPINDYYSNWDVKTLGYVFGITLDQNANPNIYVSSTQIYTSSTTNDRKVWRLDGTTGTNSLVFDFNNPSGIGTLKSTRSLGNLKYLKVGSTENIYVSDWENGSINRITGTSTGTSLWANQNAFIPKFGKRVHDNTEMPYGLAVRKMPAGSSVVYKLYYAKVSTNSNGNVTGGYGNNEIWSVDLDAVGDFVVGTEAQSAIPNINRPQSSWGGYPPTTGNPPLGTGGSICQILPTIADIAFTDNGLKMLVGQQSWDKFGHLAPHNSEVKEFINTPLLSSSWLASGNSFPSGTNLNPTCAGSLGGQANSVGGVSYSNNILNKDAQSFGCDTSVWFTSDYINVSNGNPGNTVYGIQGMKASGGTLSNSIWIDEDDNLQYYDKTFLGDVEVYKKPDACTISSSCDCGQFDSLVVTNNSGSTTYTSNWPNFSFTGSASGILFAYYHCNNPTGEACAASYNWQVTSNGNPVNLSFPLNTNSFDLAWLNTLPCPNNYKITVNPTCGSATCQPKTFYVKMDCTPPPVCTCEGTVTIDQSAINVVTQNNINNTNPVSVATTSFTLTSTTPVTEVRMLIDEFRLTTTAGNDNCMLCKNKPQTWANINSATLSGVTNQTIPTALEKDVREMVFNNGAGTYFNLNGNTLNLNLGVPGVTGLNCCTLKAEVCVKFIIRDVNCCEREIMKCFTFNLQ